MTSWRSITATKAKNKKKKIPEAENFFFSLSQSLYVVRVSTPSVHRFQDEVNVNLRLTFASHTTKHYSFSEPTITESYKRTHSQNSSPDNPGQKHDTITKFWARHNLSMLSFSDLLNLLKSASSEELMRGKHKKSSQNQSHLTKSLNPHLDHITRMSNESRCVQISNLGGLRG